MSHRYTSRIDVSEDGQWRSVAAVDDTVIEERTASDVGRAVLEDWVIDHPIGGRVVVYRAEERSKVPTDVTARVRVSVYATDDDIEPGLEPAEAVAYLLVDPEVADPHGWVNP